MCSSGRGLSAFTTSTTEAATLGTLTNVDSDSLHYELPHPYVQPMLFVKCFWDAQEVYVAEIGLDKQLTSGTVDLTLPSPAQCSAVVFNERKGNQQPEPITNWLYWNR